MANILVTGATGFIGAHLVKYLAKQSDDEIYGLCRSLKNESTFKALNLNRLKNVNLLFGNINSRSIIDEFFVRYNIDKVYHLAAQPIVQTAAKTPVSTMDTNAFGTLNLLEIIRIIKATTNKDIPTYIMSTDKAYGTHNKLPYTENFALNGIDIYSASKVCEDTIARSYAFNYDLSIVIGRPCNIYGEFDFNWSRLIPTLAKTCLEPNNKDDIILNEGSYKHVREYMYVKDAVVAIKMLIDNIDKTKGEAFNISPGITYTTEEAVQMFLALSKTNKEIKFKRKDKTFKEINKQCLDSSKLKNMTGWSAKYELFSGLQVTTSEYKRWFEDDDLLNSCTSHRANTELCGRKH